ncbi:MAG: hypothetical protein ACOCP8_05280 [archaeon]
MNKVCFSYTDITKLVNDENNKKLKAITIGDYNNNNVRLFFSDGSVMELTSDQESINKLKKDSIFNGYNVKVEILNKKNNKKNITYITDFNSSQDLFNLYFISSFNKENYDINFLYLDDKNEWQNIKFEKGYTLEANIYKIPVKAITKEGSVICQGYIYK